MLDLTLEERAVLSRLESRQSFVYRQAETFWLKVKGKVLCTLNSSVCKSLIEKRALVELGTNTSPYFKQSFDVGQELDDSTEWIYVSDPRLYAPQFELEKYV